MTRRPSSPSMKGGFLALLLGAGCVHAPAAPASPGACEGLRGRSVEGALLTGARVIAATSALPEYCEVMGTLPPSLHFEVRLPTAWNGRTVYGGGGGLWLHHPGG